MASKKVTKVLIDFPGAAYHLPNALLKAKSAGTFLDYMRNLLHPDRTFDTINQEYAKAIELGRAERVHGDSKSITGAAYCFYLKYEKGKANEPDVRFLCLAEGGKWDQKNVLIKAPFGKIAQSDRNNEELNHIDGKLFKRAVQEALKKAEAPRELYNPYNDEDIDEVDVD